MGQSLSESICVPNTRFAKLDLDFSCRCTELSLAWCWSCKYQIHGDSHTVTSSTPLLCQNLRACSCSSGHFLGFLLQVQLPSSLFPTRKPRPHLFSMNPLHSFYSHLLIYSQNPDNISIDHFLTLKNLKRVVVVFAGSSSSVHGHWVYSH